MYDFHLIRFIYFIDHFGVDIILTNIEVVYLKNSSARQILRKQRTNSKDEKMLQNLHRKLIALSHGY